MRKLALLVVVCLAACTEAAKAPVAAPPPPAPAPVLGLGKPAASLDASTAAERAEALAPIAGGRALGRVVVALGSPAEQGFWLRSGLVVVAGKGHVTTAGGGSVAVDLLPGQGPALLSLAAYRALGLALTDLPEVEVFID